MQSQVVRLGVSEIAFFVKAFLRNLCEAEDDYGCCVFVQHNVWFRSTLEFAYENVEFFESLDSSNKQICLFLGIRCWGS